MGIFKKKTKNETVITSAPDTLETAGEVKYMEQIQNPQPQPVVVEEEETQEQEPQLPQIREIPRCMSQTQINNLIIDMDLKLNYIISKIEE